MEGAFVVSSCVAHGELRFELVFIDLTAGAFGETRPTDKYLGKD